eukprot:7381094-Prymnesium_polylepis.2
MTQSDVADRRTASRSPSALASVRSKPTIEHRERYILGQRSAAHLDRLRACVCRRGRARGSPQ